MSKLTMRFCKKPRQSCPLKPRLRSGGSRKSIAYDSCDVASMITTVRYLEFNLTAASRTLEKYDAIPADTDGADGRAHLVAVQRLLAMSRNRSLTPVDGPHGAEHRPGTLWRPPELSEIASRDWNKDVSACPISSGQGVLPVW